MWIKIKESHPCFWFFSDSLLNLYKIQSLYSLKYPTWCSTVHIVKITLSHFPHPLIITKWTNVSSYHPKPKKKKKNNLCHCIYCILILYPSFHCVSLYFLKSSFGSPVYYLTIYMKLFFPPPLVFFVITMYLIALTSICRLYYC